VNVFAMMKPDQAAMGSTVPVLFKYALSPSGTFGGEALAAR
jgi:hypothetical protein